MTTTATDQEAAYAARVAANRAAKQQRIDNRGENIYEKRRQQARRDGDGARQWMRMAYANGRTSIPSRILEEAHAIMETPKMTDNDTIISLLTEIRDLLRGGALAAPAAVGEQRFTAEKMTATVNDGKAYWKVRGGMFQKFGVSIWPEVLAAAGFDFDAMNPLAVYDLAGYTAVYITDEEGNPRKVTQLIAPQASQETAVSQPVVAQQPAPEPKPKATVNLTDVRASFDELSAFTLGTVADRAVMAGFFETKHLALNAMHNFDFPKGVKIAFTQKVSKEGALSVFDWMAKAAA